MVKNVLNIPSPQLMEYYKWQSPGDLGGESSQLRADIVDLVKSQRIYA